LKYKNNQHLTIAIAGRTGARIEAEIAAADFLCTDIKVSKADACGTVNEFVFTK
jgi:hypothetical protein